MPKILFDNDIPSDLRSALEAADIGNKFFQIIKKYPLHIDQEAGAWAALELLVRGGIKSDDFVKKIERLGYIDHSLALQIGQDINREILLPIRETLQKISELSETRSAEMEGKSEILRGITNPEVLSTPRRQEISEAELEELTRDVPETAVAIAEKPVPAEPIPLISSLPKGVPISIPTPPPTPTEPRTPQVANVASTSLHEEKFAGLSHMPRDTKEVLGDNHRVIPEDLKSRVNSDPYKEPIQ